MTEVLLYDCPSYTASCLVALELVGPNVVRPSCGHEFFAKILEALQNSPHGISQILAERECF
ncbi:MAG: hypothetical protein NTV12_11695 [Verrucomicrobia bacterium]|nr:hypothetical protein [Verrucomicrobiota bacterium]